MGFVATMKTWFVCHILLGYIFIMSGLVSCLLMLIMYILVWPFSRRLYRIIVVHIAYTWWSQFTFLGQWWSGSDFTLHLENAEDMKYFGNEHTIVIMNHKYEIDWLMTWILSERIGILGGTKIYGKKMLKYLPLIGWMWTLTESIFLRREWEKDRKSISKDLAYICEYPPNYWVTLLLFCEGTRFTEAKMHLSNEIARKKGLPELKHHLLPRTKGFVLSMYGVKGKIPAITDITIGFRKDSEEPTLMNVIQGKPVRAELYIRRLPIDDIPLDSDESCGAWLHKLYQEKDEIYDHFVQNGRFVKGTKVEIPWRYRDLICWICWAVLLCVPLFRYLVNVFISGSVTLQLVTLAVVAVLTILVKLLIGVTHIEKGSAYGGTPEHRPHQNGDKKQD